MIEAIDLISSEASPKVAMKYENDLRREVGRFITRRWFF